MIFEQPILLDGHGNLTVGTVPREDLDAHLARTGGTVRLDGAGLLAAVSRVELTGRGGGHFPVARKLRPLVSSGAATVVVNASEGELLSSKDAMLLQLRPHLVLDGAQALARAVRAGEVVVWVHAGADASTASVVAACEERERDARHAGEVPVRVMAGPARYLTGEASAVIAGVRGEPALPKFVTNPAAPWVDGAPVLVHNAETHARVGLLSSDAVSFEPTSLVTVSDGNRRFVVEVAASVTFEDLFAGLGVPAPRQVLLGGFGGEWRLWSDIGGLPLDPPTLKGLGVPFGPGIIALLPDGVTGPEWSSQILTWMAGESAGRCGPCIFGLTSLAERYAAAAGHRFVSGRRARELEQHMTLVEGRGACRHPDGAVRMARSAVRVFGAGAR